MWCTAKLPNRSSVGGCIDPCAASCVPACACDPVRGARPGDRTLHHEAIGGAPCGQSPDHSNQAGSEAHRVRVRGRDGHGRAGDPAFGGLCGVAERGDGDSRHGESRNALDDGRHMRRWQPRGRRGAMTHQRADVAPPRALPRPLSTEARHQPEQSYLSCLPPLLWSRESRWNLTTITVQRPCLSPLTS